MKYYPKLTEEEIKTICFAYPHRQISKGFKKYSKDFSTLLPGHRPQSVAGDTGRKLLADNPKSNLTAKMVDALVTSWINAINATVTEQLALGKSEDFAYIVAFFNAPLDGCIPIYFRLIDKDISEERISSISAGTEALTATHESVASREQKAKAANKQAENSKKAIQDLKAAKSEIKRQAAEIKTLTKNIQKKAAEIEQFKELNIKVDNLQQKLSSREKENISLKSTNRSFSSSISKLKHVCEEKDSAIAELSQASIKINKDLATAQLKIKDFEESKHRLLRNTYKYSGKQLRPEDIDYFIEYLSYNLKSIGFDGNSNAFTLFINFLTDILFSNKPIICNHVVGCTLASCISNTICGDPCPLVIPYSSTLDNDKLLELLSTEDRVVVLDSFIGVYDELKLLPLIRRIQPKIIFITTAYDRSMTYIPPEILCYCTYLNANTIPALCIGNQVNEDPSTVPEVLVTPEPLEPHRYSQRLCKEILRQLDLPPILVDSFSNQMTSEMKLVEYLAYSILPYFHEINHVSPYSASDRLEKYAGPGGKCQYKELLMEWFG